MSAFLVMDRRFTRLALAAAALAGSVGLSDWLRESPAPSVGASNPPAGDAGIAAPRPAPRFDDGFCSQRGIVVMRPSIALTYLDGGSDTPLVKVFLEVQVRRAEGLQSYGKVEVRRARSGKVSALALLQKALEAETPAGRLAALQAAMREAPGDPGLAWELAEHAEHAGELDEAIDALAIFLVVYPVPEVAQHRRRLEVARDLLRGYRRLERHGLRLFWPPESLTDAQGLELLNEIENTLDQAAAFVGAPRRPELTTVVYRDLSELLAVTCAPSWTGGLYDGTLRLVAAPVPLGIRAFALRHEALHAQLIGGPRRMPRWFEEGTAEAFAPRKGLERSWEQMVSNRTWIPFSSLVESFTAFEEPEDAWLAYAQSRAMVELLRECGGGQAISRARDDFAQGRDTAAVLARACGRSQVTGEELLAFIERRLRR